jgi:hypothetical protein
MILIWRKFSKLIPMVIKDVVSTAEVGELLMIWTKAVLVPSKVPSRHTKRIFLRLRFLYVGL